MTGDSDLRRARVRVRSAARLVAVFLGVAGVAVLFSGMGWQARLTLWTAGFFTIVLAWEWLTSHRLAANNTSQTAADVRRFQPWDTSDDFAHVAVDDGQWYERRVTLDGQVTAIRVSTVGKVCRLALPHAIALCSDTDGLSSRFRRFTEAEAARAVEESAAVASLRIEYIDFVSANAPGTAEVSLVSLLGDDSWECLLEDGHFRDLRRVE